MIKRSKLQKIEMGLTRAWPTGLGAKKLGLFNGGRLVTFVLSAKEKESDKG